MRGQRTSVLAYLADFTLIATFIANRFWEVAPPGLMAKNGFFEHLGLFGGFLLVVWLDLRGAERDTAGG